MELYPHIFKRKEKYHWNVTRKVSARSHSFHLSTSGKVIIINFVFKQLKSHKEKTISMQHSYGLKNFEVMTIIQKNCPYRGVTHITNNNKHHYHCEKNSYNLTILNQKKSNNLNTVSELISGKFGFLSLTVIKSAFSISFAFFLIHWTNFFNTRMSKVIWMNSVRVQCYPNFIHYIPSKSLYIRTLPLNCG